MTVTAPAPGPPARPARRRRSLVLLRRVEVDSPVHRLWAGTKLVAVAAISVTVSYVPSWAAVAVTTALVLGAALAARIPRSAVPRLPVWLWITVAAGALLTLVAGGRPEVRLAAVHLGLGGLDAYARFTAITFELLGAAALVGWTTALGDVGPAFATLLSPLRRLRVPVDEWAVAIALCVRALPLLVGEMRVLLAVRRLRPRPPSPRRSRIDRYLDDAVEILVASLSVSLRRSAEMAEAMTARGGPTGITARVPGPRRADAVALVIVAAVATAAWVLPR